MNISFELDGKQAENFTHSPDESYLYYYNVTIFHRLGLEDTLHTLRMSAIPQADNDAPSSIFLFDWAEYTLVRLIVLCLDLLQLTSLLVRAAPMTPMTRQVQDRIVQY